MPLNWLDNTNMPPILEYSAVEPVQGILTSEPVTYVHDEWTKIAIRFFEQLKPSQREGAVAALRTHVQNLGPPSNGQTVPMAKKIQGAR